MNHPAPHSRSGAAAATEGPSGLSDAHRVALTEAAGMLASGQSQEAAVDHLVAHDMPRVVAKVLVKQYDKKPTA